MESLTNQARVVVCASCTALQMVQTTQQQGLATWRHLESYATQDNAPAVEASIERPAVHPDSLRARTYVAVFGLKYLKNMSFFYLVEGFNGVVCHAGINDKVVHVRNSQDGRNVRIAGPRQKKYHSETCNVIRL